jgi:hypothetical protein
VEKPLLSPATPTIDDPNVVRQSVEAQSTTMSTRERERERETHLLGAAHGALATDLRLRAGGLLGLERGELGGVEDHCCVCVFCVVVLLREVQG